MVDPAVRADEKVTAVLVAMDSTQRDALIKAIETDNPSATVEDLAIVANASPGPSYVGLTVDTGYLAAENQHRAVWELVRGFSSFWGAKGPFRNDAGDVKVSLTVSAHGATYNASYDIMVAVADRRMAEDEWFASV